MAPAWASSGPPSLILSPRQEHYQIAPHVQTFVDKSGKMSLSEVAAPASDARFRPNQSIMLKLGAVRGAAWLRFKLRFPAGLSPEGWVLVLSKHLVDEIDIYLPQPDGGWQRIAAGVGRPFPNGLETARNPSLALPRNLPRDAVIYIRLANRFGLGMSVALQSPRDFRRQLVIDSYLYGLFYGVPLALALFNLFIYLSLKARVYLSYVGFMSSMLVYQLFVHGQVELLGMHDQRLNLTLFGVSVSLAFIFGAQFSRKFLLTHKYAPIMDFLFRVVMGLAVARGLMSVVGWDVLGNHLAQFLGLLSPIMALSTGVMVWRKGFTPARYYLLAWSAFSACVVWHVLVSLGIFPWSGISSMMMVVGSAAEAILLSFALADRIRILRRERESLAEATRHYRELSNTDALTSLFNARFFRENHPETADDCQRRGIPLSLMMLDIDNFKAFNDAHGHPEGDKVLAALGQVITDCVREADLPCRYGGEEFAIILPGASRQQAGQVAERIRRQFAAQVFRPTGGSEAFSVTASLGLAQLGPAESAAELLARADQALYQAKAHGRNRVVIAP